MSVSTLQTLVTAAKSAIAGEDWTTAENKLVQAKADLITLPNANSSTHGMQWRETIMDLLEYVRREKKDGSTSGAGANNTIRTSLYRRKSAGST